MAHYARHPGPRAAHIVHCGFGPEMAEVIPLMFGHICETPLHEMARVGHDDYIRYPIGDDWMYVKPVLDRSAQALFATPNTYVTLLPRELINALLIPMMTTLCYKETIVCGSSGAATSYVEWRDLGNRLHRERDKPAKIIFETDYGWDGTERTIMTLQQWFVHGKPWRPRGRRVKVERRARGRPYY